MTQLPPKFFAPRAFDGHNASVRSSGRIAQTDGRPLRSQPLMRKYEVAHLLANGDLDIATRVAPAHPAFEDSFAALARGSLFREL